MGSAIDGSVGTLLVVCTANVCRSPLAARRFSALLGESDRLGAVDVVSAGTRAEAGRAMCEVSAAELPSGSGDLAFVERHRSRPLTREAVQGADLVIAMEREQRSAIAQLAPGSQAKVYTLREAESLLAVLRNRGDRISPDLAALARAMHSVRGFAPMPAEAPKRRWFQRAVEPEDPLTIVDGHGLDADRHAAAARAVRATTDRVAAALRALVEPSGS